MPRVLITKKFRFEAAHRLVCMPEGHKCLRVHGHNFEVLVNVLGQVHPETGMVIDFGDIKTMVNPLIELLDHHMLNERGVELGDPLLSVPTTENLAIWFYRKIKPMIPDLYSIIINETHSNSCEFRGEWED